jgi:hypothetical protein
MRRTGDGRRRTEDGRCEARIHHGDTENTEECKRTVGGVPGVSRAQPTKPFQSKASG